MTLVLGLATTKFAVLATDTRYWFPRDERFVDNNQGGKLRRGEDWWGAVGGNVAWEQCAWAAIDSMRACETAAMSAALREVDTGSLWAAIPPRERTHAPVIDGRRALGVLYLVYRTAAGYRGMTFDDVGQATHHGPGQLFGAWPPDMTFEALREHLRTWGGRPPATWRELCERVADCFLWVASRTRFASAVVELIVLTPSGDRYVSPTPATQLRTLR